MFNTRTLFLTGLLSIGFIPAAPLTYVAYQANIYSNCVDGNTGKSGLTDPSAALTVTAGAGPCATSVSTQVTETTNALDFAISVNTAHGPDLWTYSDGYALLQLTVTEDMIFTAGGTMDASASVQDLIYNGGLYDYTANQTLYSSIQISAQTAGEHFDLGGNGGDMHGTDLWGNHEALLAPSSVTLLAGHTYGITGTVWDQTLAGDIQSWGGYYNPGAGSAVSTWNYHLESAHPAPTSVPEPESLALLGLGLVGMIVGRFRSRARD